MATVALPSPLSAEGHRDRLRTRLLTAGPDALADHEMLEMTLFLAIPRRDTKPIARALLARFGSYAATISASAQALRTIPGLGDSGIAALKLVQGAAQVLARERIEQVRVLFLDSRNRLLADEAQGRGTVNHTPVYPREVVRRALELHAAALILVHNHPSGDPTPSRDDIAMTKSIAQAADLLSITLHDHVIIGNGRWFSFRRERLL